MSHSKRLAFLRQYDHYLITTHLNADGDAIASVLAASVFLDKLGKSWRIVVHDQHIDPRYAFLKNFSAITSLKDFKDKQPFDAALILDAPGRKRIGDISALISEDMPAMKIDHHPSEDDFSDLDFVEVDVSSAASLLFEIIEESDIALDKELAEALYTGIVYDTGRLSYSNTHTRDLEACARLMKYGVEPAVITRNVFLNHRPEALRVIGRGLQSVQRHLNDKVTVIALHNNELDGVEQNEIEELANYTVSVNGTEVGAYIREIEPGFFKISLRSRDRVNVREVAQAFNGGGHFHASGCRYSGTYDTLLSRLLNEISKQLQKLS